MLRRTALIAAVLLLLALIFLASGHWILAIVFGLAAAAASGRSSSCEPCVSATATEA